MRYWVGCFIVMCGTATSAMAGREDSLVVICKDPQSAIALQEAYSEPSVEFSSKVDQAIRKNICMWFKGDAQWKVFSKSHQKDGYIDVLYDLYNGDPKFGFMPSSTIIPTGR